MPSLYITRLSKKSTSAEYSLDAYYWNFLDILA
jgi:hypothetical protein